jgi:DNA/RNA-binding protein KIN17
MNATHWTSLTEFAKSLGREGICRVTEDEKGVYIAWIDNSPESLRRQDAVRKKERQDRGDEEREKKAIQEQVERAHRAVKEEEDKEDMKRTLERKDGEKITLSFGSILKDEQNGKLPEPVNDTTQISVENTSKGEGRSIDSIPAVSTPGSSSTTMSQPKVKLSFGSGPSKPKNVFAAAKKNPFAAKKTSVIEPPKKMSEAERIMKEEMERKRRLEGQGGHSGKKVRIGFP